MKWRRIAILTLAVSVMLAAAAMQKQRTAVERSFRITFGLKDAKPTNWDGQIEVTGGEVASLEGWRFENKDEVIGKVAWKCETHEYIAPGERYHLETPGQPTPKPKMQPWPNGITLTIRGDSPTVKLTFGERHLEFDADKIVLGEPKKHLGDQVQVERLPEVKILRPAEPPNAKDARQDDYPALWIRYKTNRHYLAWVCYQKGKDRILMVERDGPDGVWSEPIEVTGPGDHFRVALASTHSDKLWVVWSSQVNGNWDLYGRAYDISESPAKPAGDTVRLTEDPGPDIWHRMTTDSKGRAWLVWQGARNGQFYIFARCADEDGWHKPIKVSDGTGNNWDPCIAADTKEDRVWVGWDTYEKGCYDIRIRSIADGSESKLGRVVNDFNHTGGNHRAHVSLACNQAGHLWAAWDEAGENWGKDSGLLFAGTTARGLFHQRGIQLSRLIDGKWWGVESYIHKGFEEPLEECDELPQLQHDSEGRMWLAFRRRTCRRPREDNWAAQGRWDVLAIGYVSESSRTELIPLQQSAGRSDMRINSQRDRQGSVYFAYATDHRSWTPPAMMERNLSIAVSRLVRLPEHQGSDPLVLIQLDRDAHRMPPPVHPNEAAQVARVRSYVINHAGKTYRIYRGDLHRHTDISGDGVGDGSLMDLHRYGLDAAALDFILVADHNMGGDKEYPWWRTQKANDLYTIPGKFISMYGYERSVRYPNGHRNVIWMERGHRTLPIGNQALPAILAADTAKLYANLRETGGICTAHTSATEQGTDWKDFDPELEPIVEIFQGFQSSYEMEGAPLAIDKNTTVVHQGFRPNGFINNALDKGYRLGFQCSSDHVSTHVSYACVLAEEFSRKGLVAAMKKRHTYGATDNIIVDFRAGQLGIMGDEIATNQPRFDVNVIGTGWLGHVDVIRNGKVVHTAMPEKGSAELRFNWQDPTPEKGKTSYYYIRVVQQNKHMAWASPIWVKVD